jgi:hypothetical protein
LATQELQTLNKETQRTILKSICDNPTLSVDDHVLSLKNKLDKISRDEIIQVVHSIAPNKNWHRASEEEVQAEILEYVWTLENQILFLIPPKQKETTVAEFNQIRLQNKQSKVHKDIIRHILNSLGIESKNLAKFRTLQKEFSIQNDIKDDIQAAWLCRILFANLKPENISSINDLNYKLTEEFSDKFPSFGEKVTKSLQRICERFAEKYFPKKISDTKLKALIAKYQSIYNTWKKTSESEISVQKDEKDHNELIEKVIKHLEETQDVVNESHEGGFLGKLFSGKIKNKEGVIKKIDTVIEDLKNLCELNSKTNKTIVDKSLLVQKTQSDYENVLFVKNQLEHDLYTSNEKFKTLEEKVNQYEKELENKKTEFEKAQERISALEHKVEQIPELEARANMLREELASAKNISLSLYNRVAKIKNDLLRQSAEGKLKNNNKNYDLKSNNGSAHNSENNQPVSL